MHYVTFWKKMQTVAGLEKLSASEDKEVSRRAQGQLALACDDIFTSMKKASGSLVPGVMTMRESHRITGEKLAASPEAAAELLQKLATAEFVDSLLEKQLEKLSGDAHGRARSVQMLGREYSVMLMRGLFA